MNYANNEVKYQSACAAVDDILDGKMMPYAIGVREEIQNLLDGRFSKSMIRDALKRRIHSLEYMKAYAASEFYYGLDGSVTEMNPVYREEAQGEIDNWDALQEIAEKKAAEKEAAKKETIEMHQRNSDAAKEAYIMAKEAVIEALMDTQMPYARSMAAQLRMAIPNVKPKYIYDALNSIIESTNHLTALVNSEEKFNLNGTSVLITRKDRMVAIGKLTAIREGRPYAKNKKQKEARLVAKLVRRREKLSHRENSAYLSHI